MPPPLAGCQKSHRAGSGHGEAENEGGFEAGEQYIVSEQWVSHGGLCSLCGITYKRSPSLLS